MCFYSFGLFLNSIYKCFCVLKKLCIPVPSSPPAVVLIVAAVDCCDITSSATMAAAAAAAGVCVLEETVPSLLCMDNPEPV
jgi:hypothetical protein